jgi:hypothetical protein
MNSLIVAHVRPPNAYGITRAIEKDKEKKRKSRGVLCCPPVLVCNYSFPFSFSSNTQAVE